MVVALAGFARQSDLSLDTAREKIAPTRDERKGAFQAKQIPVTPSSRRILAAYRGSYFELAGKAALAHGDAASRSCGGCITPAAPCALKMKR